jgi:hypothetical protein
MAAHNLRLGLGLQHHEGHKTSLQKLPVAYGRVEV